MSEVIIKTDQEIELMRESGQLLSQVFSMLDDFITLGISTMQINNKVEDFIINNLNARPASKGQYGYQYALNTSVNDVVCHGIPKESQTLKCTDIINVDITLEKNGYITDSSKMYMFDKVTPQAKKLVNVTYAAMCKGIKEVKPGATLGDIGHAIEKYANMAGFTIVKEYCGHGIGTQMHEEPQVLHYGKKNTGLKLKPGMIFTIEPMINQGKSKIKTKKDGWTVVTKDKQLSAQWEHTILVTDTAFEVLTLRPDEKII
ncbi:type I methionyl aminopeptidase [Pseudoalteromonas denitrificans]|uniref:Methionine aminopeptidase n=1 Tax=Pseudoalteromonas denitrificans DSM 6059 TaxID=1123010 RepID=A0A1I1NBE3_9GAMM|nr:type I methionyl aminopeptidase [Pseudoalteromonas denitrificans]SFC92788.1 methionine aminopeptidase, type I [Pseudoalteromonas denitrificans DSM 6059]